MLHDVISHERYAALKMDVLVTLDGGGSDNGGISDPSSPEGSCSSIPQSGPSDGSGAEGPKTIADLLTSASSSVSQENPGGIFSAFGVSGAENGDNVEGGRGEKEEEFMWGCSSRQEERDQLLSFASLGCFDPSARLQV